MPDYGDFADFCIEVEKVHESYRAGTRMSPLTMAEYSQDPALPELSAQTLDETASSTTGNISIMCEGREFVRSRNKAIAHSTHLAMVFSSDPEESMTMTIERNKFPVDVVAHVVGWMDHGDFGLKADHTWHPIRQCPGWPANLSSYSGGVILHIRVFAAADYFRVAALKARITWEMEKLFDLHWAAEGFGGIVREVYDLPVQGFEKLRQTVVRAAVQHMGELAKRADVTLALCSGTESLGVFSFDLVQSVLKRTSELECDFRVGESECDRLRRLVYDVEEAKEVVQRRVEELNEQIEGMREAATHRRLEHQDIVRQVKAKADEEMEDVNKTRVRGLRERYQGKD